MCGIAVLVARFFLRGGETLAGIGVRFPVLFLLKAMRGVKYLILLLLEAV